MKSLTVEADSAAELDQKTNVLLQEGWQLHGTVTQKFDVLPAKAKNYFHSFCLRVVRCIGFNPVEIKVGYVQQVKAETLHSMLSQPIPCRVPSLKPISRMRRWQETLRK